MLEKAKQNDPALHTTVRLLIILFAFITVVITVIAWTEDFLMGLIPLGSGTLLCLGIWGDYYVSAYFYGAAIDKGYNDTIFMRLSFWTGFPGWILVCALPDRGGKDTAAAKSKADAPKKKSKTIVKMDTTSKKENYVPSTKVLRTLEEDIINGHVDEKSPSLEEYIDEDEVIAETIYVDSNDEEEVPGRKCPNCGTVHDFDYPKCPKCKYDYYGEN